MLAQKSSFQYSLFLIMKGREKREWRQREWVYAGAHRSQEAAFAPLEWELQAWVKSCLIWVLELDSVGSSGREGSILNHLSSPSNHSFKSLPYIELQSSSSKPFNSKLLWFECEMGPTGSRICTLAPQVVAQFGTIIRLKVVERFTQTLAGLYRVIWTRLHCSKPTSCPALVACSK